LSCGDIIGIEIERRLLCGNQNVSLLSDSRQLLFPNGPMHMNVFVDAASLNYMKS